MGDRKVALFFVKKISQNGIVKIGIFWYKYSLDKIYLFGRH